MRAFSGAHSGSGSAARSVCAFSRIGAYAVASFIIACWASLRGLAGCPPEAPGLAPSVFGLVSWSASKRENGILISFLAGWAGLARNPLSTQRSFGRAQGFLHRLDDLHVGDQFIAVERPHHRVLIEQVPDPPERLLRRRRE